MKKIKLILSATLLLIFFLNSNGQINFEDTQNKAVFSWGTPGEWDDGAVWFPSVIKDGDTLRMWYTGFDKNVWNSPQGKIGYAWSLNGTEWNRYKGNPVLEAEFEWELPKLSFCTVIQDVDTFKMWYGAAPPTGSIPLVIGHARSMDGKKWTKHPNPVLEKGPNGDWDDYAINPACVIKDGDHYKMWYDGFRAGFPNETAMPQTGLATSKDGIHWIKYNDTTTVEAPYFKSDPVLKVGENSAWDSHRSAFARVLSTKTGYELWYQGVTAPINTSTLAQIGYATSPDGINWTKWPENPIFKDNNETVSWGKSYYPGSVLLLEDQYHMWFACFHTSLQAQPKIGYAESNTPAWKQMKSMDIAKGTSQSCVIDDLIYVFGGNHHNSALNSADVYNTNTNEWTSLAPIPFGLAFTNSGMINGKIYLAGGWSKTPNWVTTDDTYEYNPVENIWDLKKNCPKQSGGNASCVLNDKLYLLGGLKDFPENNTTGQKDVLVYDPVTDTWDDSLPEMIYSRANTAHAIVYDDQIYVFGGITYISGSEYHIIAKVEKYDPVENTWSELPEMPVQVTGHTSLVYNEKLYVFGGDSTNNLTSSSQTSVNVNIIQEYDPKTNQWQIMEPMPFNRSEMAGQKVGNYLYLFGGYEVNVNQFISSLDEVWRFNLDSLKAAKNPGTGIAITKVNKSVLIYPNPANQTLHIEIPVQFQNEFEVKLTNITGKVILQKTRHSENIDISGIPPGIYFVSVKSKDFVTTRKIIKQ